MWKLYDSLIEPIPSEVKVKDVVCGQTWTAVRNTKGDIGLAMTTNVQTRPLLSKEYIGLPLRTVAEYVKSWNLLEAGIGMAAINSYYNTQKRLIQFHSYQKDNRFCTFDIPIKDKNVIMVGHLRHPQDLFSEAKSLFILERNPEIGDYPDSACEYCLPDSDLVIITGSAFVNKTMPRLLQLAGKADIIITGPSTPMAHQLLEFGVRRIAGLIVTDIEGVWNFACEGFTNPPYRFGQRFYLE
jgi:uncharacterized protein (DUF4213/DUF364 family)